MGCMCEICNTGLAKDEAFEYKGLDYCGICLAEILLYKTKRLRHALKIARSMIEMLERACKKAGWENMESIIPGYYKRLKRIKKALK